MKKSLLIIAAVAMSFVACSKEEIQTVSKGMTLSANVADDNTKATIAKEEGTTTWKFSWETDDVVNVTSPSAGNPSYDFTYDGTSFKCEVAEPAPGKWSAVYPADFTTNGLSFVGQDGTLAGAMAKYYMTGSCPSDGSAKLSMDMNPQVARLKVNLNPSYFSGHSSTGSYKRVILFTDKDQHKFFLNIKKDGELEGSSTALAAYDFSEGDIPTEPIYLIAPAGVELYVTNQFRLFTSLKSLEAGHIYNVTLK